MLDFLRENKKVIIAVSLGLCLCAGIAFERLYQPSAKTLKIYSQALEDYNSKDVFPFVGAGGKHASPMATE